MEAFTTRLEEQVILTLLGICPLGVEFSLFLDWVQDERQQDAHVEGLVNTTRTAWILQKLD